MWRHRLRNIQGQIHTHQLFLARLHSQLQWMVTARKSGQRAINKLQQLYL
jgi:hypothetical protein